MTMGFITSKILAAHNLKTDFKYLEPCQECLEGGRHVTRACGVGRYSSRGSAGPILPLLAGLLALWLAFLLTLAAGA
ncbi:hypothetical protein D3867_36195 (plasmid) [Azospirillum argentinense]|uniref:Uncharacterized protein n=1 Tax=Azospirillum brasilense TaxID=192 RepID=A0A4D8QC42_AZOBR|nr:hypothetical protein D3867_36195 [Azospirillum argentinense]